MEFCQNCAEGDILAQEVDFVDFQEYRNVDLDRDPILVLNCGHIFTMSTLDTIMDMPSYYEMDGNGYPVAIKDSKGEDFSKGEIKSCPTCRGSLRNVTRYGRIVRRALLDDSTKKFICWANAEYIPLAKQLMDEQDKLSGSVAEDNLSLGNVRLMGPGDAQIVSIRHNGGYKRYGAIFALRRRILQYEKLVRPAEQPFQRVRDMVEATRRRKAGAGTTITPFEFDQRVLHTEGILTRPGFAPAM